MRTLIADGNFVAKPPVMWGTILCQNEGKDYEEIVETIQGNYNIFYNNV